jgi:hypothetical protein
MHLPPTLKCMAKEAFSIPRPRFRISQRHLLKPRPNPGGVPVEMTSPPAVPVYGQRQYRAIFRKLRSSTRTSIRRASLSRSSVVMKQSRRSQSLPYGRAVRHHTFSHWLAVLRYSYFFVFPFPKTASLAIRLTSVGRAMIESRSRSKYL